MAGFNPRQLIQRARLSVGDGAIRGGKRPQQTSLRRAISDSYYALFHRACTHRADYDPLETFSLTVTRVIIDIAEAAITDFDHAPAADRKSFVLLSLFEPRA